ncbi:MAG: substrate-binding domain-containing protein [Cellulomonas sp.]|nr:substrate-binding domain-containing protein [Cellulomonas sp.]
MPVPQPDRGVPGLGVRGARYRPGGERGVLLGAGRDLDPDRGGQGPAVGGVGEAGQRDDPDRGERVGRGDLPGDQALGGGAALPDRRDGGRQVGRSADDRFGPGGKRRDEGVDLDGSGTVRLPPGVPVVVVDSNAGEQYAVVDTDQANGARQAVEHLLDLGHRTVWHLAGPEESFAAGGRAAAWEATLREHDREVPAALRGDWSAHSGYVAGLRLADEPTCTAVFSANDQMALGLLRAFHERGHRVPDDVSIVGFDDLPDTDAYTPPLTTVHQDFAEVGRHCVELVVRQLGARRSLPGRTLVGSRLVVRQSTAPPRVSS